MENVSGRNRTNYHVDCSSFAFKLLKICVEAADKCICPNIRREPEIVDWTARY